MPARTEHTDRDALFGQSRLHRGRAAQRGHQVPRPTSGGQYPKERGEDEGSLYPRGNVALGGPKDRTKPDRTEEPMGKPNCDLTILNISTGGPPPQGKYRGGGYRGTAVRIPEKGSMLDDEKVLLPHQSRAIPSHGRGPGKTNRGAGRTLKMTSPRWGSHPSVGTTGGGAGCTSQRGVDIGVSVDYS